MKISSVSHSDIPISEEVYEGIKARIAYLEYQPGQVLPIRKLANDLGVSATPIREALVRLEYDGLVRRSHNSSAHVSEVSFKNLKDIFEVRLFLIEQAGQLSARRVSETELAQLKMLVGEIERARSSKEVMQLDAKLHELIYDATKNHALAKVLGLLRVQITRLWVFIEHKEEFSSLIVDDWKRLLKALGDRDEARSAAILKEHALKFIAEVRKFIGS